MIPVTLKWIEQQVDGELIGQDATINEISTDTRQISPGALFIALIGPNFDGHQFIDVAEKAGARAVIVEKHVETTLPQIRVADTRLALGALGAGVKERVSPITVAITGSSGKTTVKEMVASILSRRGKVLATQGNFNNDIGVPLTLLRLEQDHDFAVMELGANHLGEIAYTTALVKPDVALLNNAAASHLEGFGSLFGVARAKAEIFNSLTAQGTALINGDSDFALFWQRRLVDKNVKVFATEHDADYRVSDIEFDVSGCASFNLTTDKGNIFIELHVPGKHNVANALAAASIALNVGATLEDVQLGLADMNPVKGRLNIHQLTPQIRLIDDTYNANVESTKAAIDLLASYPGRRIFLMGDMAELGQKARFYHEEIGAYAKEAGIDNLFSLGVLSQSTSEVFNGSGKHFDDLESLMNYLEQSVRLERRAISILVKGSRSSKMERVVQALKDSPLASQNSLIQEARAC